MDVEPAGRRLSDGRGFHWKNRRVILRIEHKDDAFANHIQISHQPVALLEEVCVSQQKHRPLYVETNPS